MTFKTATLFACAALTAVAFTTPGYADDAGEIKYRQSVMKSIGGHMGAIVGILKGQTINKEHLAVHTQGIAELSKIVGHIFPKGSDFGETEALPAIWEKPDDFSKAVKMLQDAAGEMNEAGMSGDLGMVGQALGGLGKACKNCHENFREKKN